MKMTVKAMSTQQVVIEEKYTGIKKLLKNLLVTDGARRGFLF